MRVALSCLLLGAAAGCSEALAKSAPDMVAIVVAARDLPAGSKPTIDDVSQRSVAAAFVTSSMVKPDSVTYVLNQPTLLPILAGDPLYWAMFEATSSDLASYEACRAVLGEERDAQKQVARARALVRFSP